MDACLIPQAAEPCAIVIFGASGDLTKRKLLPSLYNLGSYHLLPAHFSIIGVARRPLSDDIFRDQLGKDLAELGTQPVDPNLWSKFRERISYCAGEFDKPETYKKLAEALRESEKKFGTSGNAVFYLSVQPDYFATIAERLSEAGLLREENGRWRRVIIEKPFGHDLDSARKLNAELTSVL
jgi:glucose-6-phosphate 1-dehydrogenase